MLEIRVDDQDFDFASAGTDIDGYCLQNDIPSSAKYRIQLTFEELTSHILKPVIDRTPVLITIEHSEKDDYTEITASYGGEKFDPAESEDDFSYHVLYSTVKSFTYRYNPEAEQANTIKILI